MNRFNYSSDDPMLTTARRNRMLGRCIAGVVVVASILAVTVHSAWQQPSGSSQVIIDAGSDHSAVAGTSTDTSLDAQLRVDPSEIMFYSSNVHG